MSEKAQALEFLQSMHRELDAALPPPALMQAQISDLWKLGRADVRFRYLSSGEHAFTRGIVLPNISALLTGTLGLSRDQARQALLVEGWRNHPEISSNTPARTVRHPFDKALIPDPALIYRKWAKTTRRLPLTQSCPDFALRPPCPHKIVFEAKYYTSDSRQTAERELVTNLYQAFFYRALPAVPESKYGRTWDYDYACLFAYDASPQGTLKAAWEALDPDVRSGFWEGANVYVMVLRGS